MRRPYIYPHRSTRVLPLVSRRFAGGAAAAAVMTVAIWHWIDVLLFIHNAIAFTLVDVAAVPNVQAMQTTVFGRPVPVLVTFVVATNPWLTYGTAAIVALLVLALAWYVPLARGVAVFLVTIIVASMGAYYVRATAMEQMDTFPVVWTHTELLIWVVLPSMAALLFVTAQPSWLRGLCWMAAIEIFAIFWSAARFVVVLGVAHAFGPILLPAMWFAWGLLADVLYITTFYSMVVHVNLHLTPERRTIWAS